MRETIDRVICGLCPHACALVEGQTGYCRGRANQQGKIRPLNYGKVTSLALDPIEKKPLRQFYPGSRILSVGSFGCNLRCPFCQNYTISQQGKEIPCRSMSAEELAGLAGKLSQEPPGNIGVAFTYNEPLIGWEFLLDTARLVRADRLKVVVVTNGMIEEEPLRALLPWIDAMNIDLKAFNPAFYDWVGGSLETVKRSIRLASAACHVEVTTLVIPGKNDSEAEMAAEAQWLAGVDPNIPLHISRYFPYYQSDIPATPAAVISRLVEVAGRYLPSVYPGNL